MENNKSVYINHKSLMDIKREKDLMKDLKLKFSKEKWDVDQDFFSHQINEYIHWQNDPMPLINEFAQFCYNRKEEIVWEWYNNINNTGWEEISPADMDAIIAHGLNPQPQFRKIIIL